MIEPLEIDNALARLQYDEWTTIYGSGYPFPQHPPQHPPRHPCTKIHLLRAYKLQQIDMLSGEEPK